MVRTRNEIGLPLKSSKTGVETGAVSIDDGSDVFLNKYLQVKL